MLNATHDSALLCDYYANWVKVYKEGAVRDVTMGKYKAHAVMAGKTCARPFAQRHRPRIVSANLINRYAYYHERQTTMDFHHQAQRSAA